MSASTTSGAGRTCGRRQRMSHSSPPWRAMACSVARPSGRPGCSARTWRREGRGSNSTASRFSSCSAARHSSAVMVSKSALRSTSCSLNVSCASTCSSSGGGGCCGACGWCGNSASPSRRFSGGGGVAFSLACTRGSSMAIMRPARSGSRQNRWKACSNSSMCSTRSMKHAASVSWKSRLLSSPATCSAVSASWMRSVPSGSPACRSTRPKCITFSARWPGRLSGARSMVSRWLRAAPVRGCARPPSPAPCRCRPGTSAARPACR